MSRFTLPQAQTLIQNWINLKLSEGAVPERGAAFDILITTSTSGQAGTVISSIASSGTSTPGASGVTWGSPQYPTIIGMEQGVYQMRNTLATYLVSGNYAGGSFYAAYNALDNLANGWLTYSASTQRGIVYAGQVDTFYNTLSTLSAAMALALTTF